MINYFEILNFIKFEIKKQERTLNLIASENYSSLSSILYNSSNYINKYTEGYPKNRYYSGCKYFDIIENKTILNSQQLYNCSYTNVQPHSGSQANFAALQSLINKNEKILSLDLKSGGHLTHGFFKNFSGKYFDIINYCLDKKNMINENYINKILKIEKPKVLILGFSSYQLDLDWKKIIKFANKNNCYSMTDISHISGFIASGLLNNPINSSNLTTSTTHKTLRGVRGGIIITQCSKMKNRINNSVFPGQQGGCIPSTILGKYISFKEAKSKNFILYSKQILINSKIMLKTFLMRGYKSILNETKNHIVIIDLSHLDTLKIEKILEKYCILVNKNFIPNDIKKSIKPSGIRLGLSCLTTRKIKNLEIELITNYICDIIELKNKNIKFNVRILCKYYFIYK